MATLVYFKGPNFKESYREEGMTLIEAPRSNMAPSNDVLAIEIGMENIPGSSHFLDRVDSMRFEVCSPTCFFFKLLKALFLSSSSLVAKNFAAKGSFLISSKSSLFSSTSRKDTRMSLWLFKGSFLARAIGNGAMGL